MLTPTDDTRLDWDKNNTNIENRPNDSDMVPMGGEGCEDDDDTVDGHASVGPRPRPCRHVAYLPSHSPWYYYSLFVPLVFFVLVTELVVLVVSSHRWRWTALLVVVLLCLYLRVDCIV